MKITRLRRIAICASAVGCVFITLEVVYSVRPEAVNESIAIALLWPGALLNVVLALVLGQGIHGGEFPYWLMDTLSWAFYVLLAFLVWTIINRAKANPAR